MPGNEQKDIAGQVEGQILDTMAKNPGIAAAALGLVAGTVVLAKIVYNSLTEIPEFSKAELARHHALLSLWKKHFPEKDIPPDWLLEKNKPKVALDLVLNGRRLKAEAESIRKSHTHDHEARAMMLNHIGDLFLSMSKRWKIRDGVRYFSKYAVRPDGVDMMFYNQLADWLLKEAPNLFPDQDESIEAYAVMLSYCSSVEQRVLTADYREVSRNNPNATLTRIIANLQNHHDKLIERNLAKSFNALMSDLENLVLGLASQSLDMVYLLINNTEGTHLILDKFLSPTSVDHKIQGTRQTQLGEWLYQTLQVAGITYQTFEPTRTLSLKKDIKTHLSGQHPYDKDYHGNDYSWGERPFTKMSNEHFPNGSTKSRHYLAEIREMLRSILELYYMTQNLIRSSRASENFGDIWIYGNPAAKANLKELLASVKFVTDAHINRFTHFWDVYYTQDFLTVAKQKPWDLSKREYTPLVHINDTILIEIQALRGKITTKNEGITARLESYPERAPLMLKSKIEFFKGVLEHREYHQQTDSEDYHTAKAELERLSRSEEFNAAEAQDDLEMDVAQLSLAHAKESTVIPDGDKLAQALDCLMVAEKGEFIFSSKYQHLFHIAGPLFYSDLQRRVYETVLRKYHDLVNHRPSSDFWLGSLHYNSAQFTELRYRYACLYDAFEILYPAGKRLSAVELAIFKRDHEVALGIFDQALFKFIAIIEHQSLLFRVDSHITLPEVLSDAHSATYINREDDGHYTVERQQRYSALQAQTGFYRKAPVLVERAIDEKDELLEAAEPKQKRGFFDRLPNPFQRNKAKQQVVEEELRLEAK